MVTDHSIQSRSCRRGSLTVELMVGMAILVLAIFPVGYSYVREAQSLRATYHRAVAMEVVDGEMEILMAGEWQAYPEGQQTYAVQGEAASKLPPGEFRLTRTGNTIRLEWKSEKSRGIGPVMREATIK